MSYIFFSLLRVLGHSQLRAPDDLPSPDQEHGELGRIGVQFSTYISEPHE